MISLRYYFVKQILLTVKNFNCLLKFILKAFRKCIFIVRFQNLNISKEFLKIEQNLVIYLTNIRSLEAIFVKQIQLDIKNRNLLIKFMSQTFRRCIFIKRF